MDRKYGVLLALYCYKKNVYLTIREPALEEHLAGIEPRTAFGQSRQKLGKRIIVAHSSQAKGRVERSNGTYQDRLVKEMGLRGIKTIATTDQLLQDTLCDELNTKFAVSPLEKRDFHRPVPKGLRLKDVFSHEDYRTVQNDWIVNHKSTHYQILKTNRKMPRPKDKVIVRTRLDATKYSKTTCQSSMEEVRSRKNKGQKQRHSPIWGM